MASRQEGGGAGEGEGVGRSYQNERGGCPPPAPRPEISVVTNSRAPEPPRCAAFRFEAPWCSVRLVLRARPRRTRMRGLAQPYPTHRAQKEASPAPTASAVDDARFCDLPLLHPSAPLPGCTLSIVTAAPRLPLLQRQTWQRICPLSYLQRCCNLFSIWPLFTIHGTVQLHLFVHVVRLLASQTSRGSGVVGTSRTVFKTKEARRPSRTPSIWRCVYSGIHSIAKPRKPSSYSRLDYKQRESLGGVDGASPQAGVRRRKKKIMRPTTSRSCSNGW